MKIDSQNASIELGAYLKKVGDPLAAVASKRASSVAKISTFDKVHLSERALEVQHAQQMLQQMPGIRTEKIEQVKIAVIQGTYHVPGITVARDMMRESFENEMILKRIDTKA